MTASSGQRKVCQLKRRSQRRQGLRLRRRLWPPLDCAVTISSKDRGGEGTERSVVGACERHGIPLSVGGQYLTGLEQRAPIREPPSIRCERESSGRGVSTEIVGPGQQLVFSPTVGRSAKIAAFAFGPVSTRASAPHEGH